MWIPYSELQKIWIAGYGLIARDPLGSGPNDALICAQDEAGGWVELVEEDDVPENVDETGVAKDAARSLVPDTDMTDTVGQLVPDRGRDLADWFVFDVAPQADPTNYTGRAARLELRDMAPGAQLQLKVTDQARRTVGSSSELAADGTVSLTKVLCTPGRYFVKVAPVGNTAGSAYTLRLTFQDPQPTPAPEKYEDDVTLAPYERDDDICGATAVAVPDEGLLDVSVSGSVGNCPRDAPAADQRFDRIDWWKVTMPRAAVLRASSTTHTLIHIARGDTPESAVLFPSQRLREVCVSVRRGETLYVRIIKSNTSTLCGDYTLRIVENETCGQPVSLTRSSGPSWSATGESMGLVAPTAEDFYAFSVPPSVHVAMEVSVLSSGLHQWEYGYEVDGVIQETDPKWAWLVRHKDNTGPSGDPEPDPMLDKDKIPMRPDDDQMGTYARTLDVDSQREGPVRLAVAVVGRRDDLAAGPADYRLRVTVTPIADGDDTDTQPGLLAINGLPLGQVALIGGTDMADWYELAHASADPGASETSWILAVSDPAKRLFLEARATAGSLVLEDADEDPATRTWRLTIPAGTPTPIKIGVLAPTGSATTEYGLRAIPSVPVRAEPEANDKPATGDPLALNETRTGAVGPTDPRDYFSVPIVSDAPLRVSVTAGFRVSVWDSTGKIHYEEANPATQVLDVLGAPPGQLIVLVEPPEGATSTTAYDLEVARQ
jgi:hypothetical protein